MVNTAQIQSSARLCLITSKYVMANQSIYFYSSYITETIFNVSTEMCKTMVMVSKPIITTTFYDVSCLNTLGNNSHDADSNTIDVGKYKYIYQSSVMTEEKRKGKQLVIESNYISWFDAEKECQNINGHLVSVHSQQEMDEIKYSLLHFVCRPCGIG